MLESMDQWISDLFYACALNIYILLLVYLDPAVKEQAKLISYP